MASDLQHRSGFPYVPTLCTTDAIYGARGLMHVAAIEILGLPTVDELAHGRAAEVLVLRGAIEQRSFGRAMANEDQRIRKRFKGTEPLRNLRLRVFTRRFERRQVGISQRRQPVLAQLNASGMQIAKPKVFAEIGYVLL